MDEIEHFENLEAVFDVLQIPLFQLVLLGFISWHFGRQNLKLVFNQFLHQHVRRVERDIFVYLTLGSLNSVGDISNAVFALLYHLLGLFLDQKVDRMIVREAEALASTV